MIKIKYLSKADGRYYISLKDHNKLMREQKIQLTKEISERLTKLELENKQFKGVSKNFDKTILNHQKIARNEREQLAKQIFNEIEENCTGDCVLPYKYPYIKKKWISQRKQIKKVVK